MHVSKSRCKPLHVAKWKRLQLVFEPVTMNKLTNILLAYLIWLANLDCFLCDLEFGCRLSIGAKLCCSTCHYKALPLIFKLSHVIKIYNSKGNKSLSLWCHLKDIYIYIYMEPTCCSFWLKLIYIFTQHPVWLWKCFLYCSGNTQLRIVLNNTVISEYRAVLLWMWRGYKSMS